VRRFACTTCRKRLKVPDNSAGNKVVCPRCGQKLRIPLPPQPTPHTVLGVPLPSVPDWLADVPDEQRVTVDMPTASRRPSRQPPDAASLNDPASPTPSSAVIEFSCPKCKARCTVSVLAAGRQAECLQCGTILQIPGPPVPTHHPVSAPSQEEILDALPADGEPSGGSTADSRPAGDMQPAGRRLPVPRFTREGALIECPYCYRLVHLQTYELNEVVPCRSCDQFLIAIVTEGGTIPMDCRQCRCELKISERMAGGMTTCPNCDAPVHVPTVPILVLKSEAPSSSSGWALAAGVALLTAGAVLRSRSAPRRCIRCWRYLRNPSPYCYLCQKELGM
jgi:hypothetical protein